MQSPILFSFDDNIAQHNSNDLSITFCILQIFLAAEFATLQDNEAPWLTEKKLNKRRGVLRFDNHLQQMLLYTNRISDYHAKCIECGNKSLYKTELRTVDGYCLHFNHSFDASAKYNTKYIETNTDPYDPKFAYFLYKLNPSKDTIISLKFIIPSQSTNASALKELDLSNTLNDLRKVLLNNKITNPANILKPLKWQDNNINIGEKQ